MHFSLQVNDVYIYQTLLSTSSFIHIMNILPMLVMIYLQSACCFLLIFVLGTGLIHASDGNETDRLALLDVKRSILQDPQHALISWNDSLDFCRWEGVTCGRKHNRVVALDFTSRGLIGTLSPSIGNLSFLQALSLFNNSFNGQIPHEIGRLFRLQKLSLTINHFEGEVPANISNCLNLEYLSFGYNKLVGVLPRELTSLSKLTDLVIHNNSFTGGIPHFLGNLTSLQSLSAADNLFGGTIPDSFGQLKNLRKLGLGRTYLTGMITPLYNLSLLTILSLGGNNLEGSLLPRLNAPSSSKPSVNG